MDPLWWPVPADHSVWPPGATTARLPFGCMTSDAPSLPLVRVDQSGVWPGASRTRLPLACMVSVSWPPASDWPGWSVWPESKRSLLTAPAVPAVLTAPAVPAAGRAAPAAARAGLPPKTGDRTASRTAALAAARRPPGRFGLESVS